MRHLIGSLDRKVGVQRTRLWSPDVVPSGGFNPADYGSDYSWWAARLESYTNGQDVATWTDRGSGTLTVSAGAGQEPTFHTSADPVSPNGQPFLRWASGDRLLNAATGITGPWTAAVVMRPTAITGTTYIIGSRTPLGSISALRFRTTSGGELVVYTGITSQIIGASYAPLTPLGWQIAVVTFGGDQRINVFKGGLTAGASPNNYLGASYVSGGAFNVPAGTFALGSNLFVGEIAEAVVWRSAITDSNKILIGKALSDLYGITY